jgi:hypothetical protein
LAKSLSKVAKNLGRNEDRDESPEHRNNRIARAASTR